MKATRQHNSGLQIRNRSSYFSLFFIVFWFWPAFLNAQFYITTNTPPHHTPSFSNSGQFSLTFNTTVNSATATSNSLPVYGSIQGLIHGTYNVVGNQVAFSPNLPYRSGEIISFTATENIRSTSNIPNTSTTDYSFVAQTAPATAIFSPNLPEMYDTQNMNTPYTICAADLDGNESADIVVADILNSEIEFYFIDPNNGSLFNQYNKHLFLPGAPSPPDAAMINSIVCVDIDKDYDNDVIASGHHGLTILINTSANGIPSFDEYLILQPDIEAAITTDFNADGRMDIVCVDRTNSKIYLFRNNPNFTNYFANGVSINSNASDPYKIACGDYNIDGSLDLFVVSGNSNQVSFYKNSPQSATYFSYDYSLTPNYPDAHVIKTADFNNDSYVDFAFLSNMGGTPNYVEVYFNNVGGFSTSNSTVVTVGARTLDITLGDFDGNGTIDILNAGDIMNLGGIELILNQTQNGGNTFSYTQNTQLTQNIQSVIGGLCNADFNSDGFLDFASTQPVGPVGPGGVGFSRIFLNNVQPIANTPPVINPIADANICESGTSLIPFVINDLETPLNQLVITATSNCPNYFPNGSVNINPLGANGNTGPYSLVMDLTPAQLFVGTCTITVTVTDGGGLVATEVFDVTGFAVSGILPNVYVDIGNNNPSGTICPGQTAYFYTQNYVSQGTNPFFQWQISFDGGATFSNIPGANNPTLNYVVTIPDFTYYFQCIMYSSEACVPGNPAVTGLDKIGTYKLDPFPITTGPNPPIVCPGDAVDLDATAGLAFNYTNFTWTPLTDLTVIGSGHSATSIPTMPITYTLTVTSPDGCLYSTSVFVDVYQNPIQNYNVLVNSAESVGGNAEETIAGSGQNFLLTTDPGYVIATTTYSQASGDIQIGPLFPNGESDIWIQHVNGSNNPQTRIGGDAADLVHCIRQVSNGDFIVIGTTNSSNLPNYQGLNDVYIARRDNNLNNVWQKCYGSSSDENGYSIVEVPGGFVFVAQMKNSTGTVGATAYMIDGNGGDIWQYDWNDTYNFYNIELLTNGNLLLTGTREVSGSREWVIATMDQQGGNVLEHYYFGSNNEFALSAKEAPNGNIYVSGTTDYCGTQSAGNLTVVCIDPNWNIVWQKCPADVETNVKAYSDLEVDYDGGVLYSGYILDTQNGTGYNYAGGKYGTLGNLMWSKNFGGSSDDFGLAIRKGLVNPEYYMFGTSNSNDIDIQGDNNGDFDIWFVNFGMDPDCPELLPAEICQGVAVSSNLNLPGTYSYSWLIDGSVVSTQMNLVNYTFNTPGQHSVQLMVNDGNCNYSCPVQYINVVNFSNLNVTTPLNTCAGGTVQLSASGGDGIHYVWSPTIGLSNPNISNPTATVFSTTPYVVTSTAYGQGGNALCLVQATVNIIVNPITVNAGTDKFVCAGNSTTLNATSNTPGVTFSWTPTATLNPTTGPSVVASPTVNTNYTVVASLPGSTCNTANDIVLVTVEALPQLTITSTMGVSCSNATDGSVTFTVSNSNNFTYEVVGIVGPINSTSSSPITVTGLAQGSFILKIIDLVSQNDCSYQQNFDIGPGWPVFTPCPSLLQCGETTGTISLQFTATRQNPGSLPGNNFNFEVTGPNNYSFTGTGNYQFGTLVNVTLPPVTNGNTYTVTLLASGSNACVISMPFTVNDLEFSVQPSASNYYICNASDPLVIPINIVNNSASACMPPLPVFNFNYQLYRKVNGVFTTLGNQFSGPANYTFNPFTYGYGEYKLTASFSTPYYNCTIGDAYFNVNTSNLVVVTIQSTNPLCPGSSNGSATAYVTGASGNVTYTWTNQGGTVISTNYSAINLPAGTYSVLVEDPANPCPNPVPQTVTLVDPLPIVIDPPVVDNCMASITATGGTPGYTFDWYKQETVISLPGQYFTWPNGTQVQLPQYPDDPLLDAIPYDQSTGTYGTFNWANTSVTTAFVLAYTEFSPAGSNPYISNYINPEVGTYQVIVTDANGCTQIYGQPNNPPFEIQHESGPRNYDICFNWKTRVIEDVPPTEDPVTTVNMAAIAATDIKQAIEQAVEECIVKNTSQINEQLTQQCDRVEYLNDDLKLEYKIRLHHYTLYYYDRAGNLVRTVPPKGFNTIDPNLHTLVTGYDYNSLNQLVSQNTPDGGGSQFLYNNVGQLRFSQNAEQAFTQSPDDLDPLFSYTNYDLLGRVKEVGQSKLTGIFEVGNPQLDLSADYTSPDISQVTKTFYSDPIASVTYKGQNQRFLQNRVSYSTTTNMNGEVATSYYSYDPHGNVEWMISEIPGFGRTTIAYEYDLISGKVLKVRFNEGRPDEFYHRYDYDEDNRLVKVETSPDGYIWDNDASNQYYQHGPLQRVEIGEDKIQGIDYAYTLQGWLKAINNPDLVPANDLGQDGEGASQFVPDVFGMMLGYYTNDFKRNDPNNFLVSNTTNSKYFAPPTVSGGVQNLYNGNIATWISKSDNYGGNIEYGDFTTGEKYVYDRLNRLKSSNFYTFDGSNWNSMPNDEYKTTYAYDANGNITNLSRFGYTPPSPPVTGGLNFDQFVYDYNAGNNQLNRVKENAPSSLDGDFDDIEDQLLDNYKYDKSGNLVSDVAEKLNKIVWNVQGKVSQIIPEYDNTPNAQKPLLKFTYDASGNRIKKEVNSEPYDAGGVLQLDPVVDPEKVVTTYYARDASGNILSTYSRVNTAVAGTSYFKATFTQDEVDLYGSDRLGMIKPGRLIAEKYFFPEDFNNVNIEFDDFKRITEYTVPIATTKSIFTLSLPGNIFIDIPMVHVKNIGPDHAAPHQAGTFNFAGTAGNAVASVENLAGDQLFSVISSEVWGSVNTTMVLDVNGNLMAGSGALTSQACDMNSKPVILNIPGSTKHYIFTRNNTGELYYHEVDLSLPGYGTAQAPMGEVTSAMNLVSVNGTDKVGRHMAVIEDYFKNKSYVYFTQHNSGTHKTTISRLILVHGFTSPIVETLGEYDSYDLDGDGEIQISPNGKTLSVYNHKEQIGFLGHREFELVAFNLDANYKTEAFPAAVRQVPYANLPKGSVEYSYDQTAVYFTQNAPINIPGVVPPTSKAIFEFNLYQNSSSQYALYKAGAGDIRRMVKQEIQPGQFDHFNYSLAADALTQTIWNTTNFFDGTQANDLAFATLFDPGQTLSGYLPYMNHKVYPIHIAEAILAREVGKKQYELKDHLGNVRVVVSDRKYPSIPQLKAEIAGITNYYPFGMVMPGRNYSSGGYRFGFNGKEKDDEIKGGGNSLDFGSRIYDARLARWFSVDPMAKKYPEESPYDFALNNPIYYVDPDGGEVEPSDNSGTVTPNALLGTLIHAAAKVYFDTQPGYKGEVSFSVPLIKPGRADLIYKDANGKAAIWEIKPVSYRTAVKNAQAQTQVARYRALAQMEANANGDPTEYSIGSSGGAPLPIEGSLKIPFSDGVYNYEATLFIPKGEENKGLIYYTLENKGLTEGAKVVQDVAVKTAVVVTVAAVTTVAVVAAAPTGGASVAGAAVVIGAIVVASPDSSPQQQEQ